MDEWNHIPTSVSALSTVDISPSQPRAARCTTRLSQNAVLAQYRSPAAPTTAAAANVTSPRVNPGTTITSSNMVNTSSSPPMSDKMENKNCQNNNAAAAAAAAADEWACVEQRVISETFVSPRVVNSVITHADLHITFSQAWAVFFNDIQWRHKDIQKPVSRSNNNAISRLLTPKLDRALHEERQFVYYFQKVPLDHSLQEHVKVITTIYQHLTNDNGRMCTTGDHMQKIGFQGNDPATDLRTSGMFSLLQCLFLVSKAPALSTSFYSTSISSTHEFPFVLCSINFTTMVLDMFRDKRLHKLANHHHSVINVMNQVYVGIFIRFIAMWTSKPERSIGEWNEVRVELKAFITSNVPKLFEEGGSTM
jgi:hypothetical protein